MFINVNHNLGHILSGWDEGCLTMMKGEKARFILQAHKAYGSGGFPAWGYPLYDMIFTVPIVIEKTLRLLQQT